MTPNDREVRLLFSHDIVQLHDNKRHKNIRINDETIFLGYTHAITISFFFNFLVFKKKIKKTINEFWYQRGYELVTQFSYSRRVEPIAPFHVFLT